MKRKLLAAAANVAAAVVFCGFAVGSAYAGAFTGACCHPDGSCNDFEEASCTGESEFQGVGTVCDIGVCPQPPKGACCHPDGSCNDFLETSCTGDSVFQGDGTVCEIDLCPQPPTTTTLVDPVICGDANMDGSITASDALAALKTAVGTASCAEDRCDYNGDGDVKASDALAILKRAVGQSIPAMCPTS